MSSARQSDPHKKRWEWAKATLPEKVKDLHVATAYGLKIPPCKPGTCNRRGGCKGNPNCIQNIGEKFWLGTIEDSFWTSTRDPSLEEREEKSFVGLQNLGATCYMNTLLQLWFHTQAFRSAVYSWSPRLQVTSEKDQNDVGVVGVDSKDGDASQKVEDHCNGLQPPPPLRLGEFPGSNEVCGQLQLIFTLLEYSSRRYIDPSSIVSSLGLDKDVQQDAQEFCKLFMTLLEKKLSREFLTGNVIRGCFGGNYSYETTCSVCHNKSSRSSQFYELDLNIQGKSTLQECIQDFLQEEKLEGDDQYYCGSQCFQKQNGARRIVIESLPPVLNFQLLRFVFDRETLRKKKLTSYVQFPEELDMSVYCDAALYPSSGQLYDLKAVLTHQGPSAYSGHYIAYLYMKETGDWWSFNDEKVTKLNGKKLNLATHESQYDMSKPRSKPKPLPNHQMSSRAYMLVYTQRKEEDEMGVSGLSVPPAHLQELVSLDNSCFEQWLAESRKQIRQRVANGRALQEAKCQLFHELICRPGGSGDCWEWISLEWLKLWLSRDCEKSPSLEINQSEMLCRHGRVDPLKSEKLKRICSKTAEKLFHQYGGHPRLAGDIRFCVECVKQQCRKIQLRDRLLSDHRLIASLVKTPCSSSSGFWVGKYSLRVWKKMWEEKLMVEGKTTENRDVQDGGSSALGAQSSETENETAKERVEQADFEFNQELLCKDHGKFTTKESGRRLISAEVWQRLKEYFPDAPEFPALHLVCSDCVQGSQAVERERNLMKDRAHLQKSELLDLYHDRNRPETKIAETYFVVSSEFLHDWRKFVRYPHGDIPPVVDNSDLMCCHGGLRFDPESQAGLKQERYCIVTEKEWETLKSFYPLSATQEITVWGAETDGSLKSRPDPCERCIAVECDLQMQKNYEFDDACVFVRRMDSKKPDAVYLGDDGDSEMHWDGKGIVNSLVEVKDPADPIEKHFSKKAKMDEDFIPRRSGRRRHLQHGEEKITISSHNTLKDLKLKIMNKFLVAPFDQHLFLDGRNLAGDELTLEVLGVQPNNMILLKVDEVTEDYPVGLPSDGVPIEEGFKGTSLLGP
eukprot:m.41061 g.41061  ORF g.41061 m.41061 type:complete len:1074 (+) comp33073_c0_seq3:2-3223(+)